MSRAKYPAMKKNSVMRKLCETKLSPAKKGLRDLSMVAHSPGGRPGTNDSVA